MTEISESEEWDIFNKLAFIYKFRKKVLLRTTSPISYVRGEHKGKACYSAKYRPLGAHLVSADHVVYEKETCSGFVNRIGLSWGWLCIGRGDDEIPVRAAVLKRIESDFWLAQRLETIEDAEMPTLFNLGKDAQVEMIKDIQPEG